MKRLPPRATSTDTLCPDTTLFRAYRDPLQGVTIDAGNGVVHWGAIEAAGADFAYLFATDGDARVDPTYARNMAAAREAGIRTGPIHRYNLCKLATDQAANFIRHVPRRDRKSTRLNSSH